MDKCPGLIGGLNDPSTSCNIQCPIDEQISGVLEKLPGDNSLGPWGVPVAGGSTTPATSADPVLSPAPATSIAPVESFKPPPSAASPVKPSSSPAPVSSSAAGGKDVSAPTVVKTVAPGAGDSSSQTLSSSSSSVAPGWAYHGCYSDSLSNRALTGIEFANVGQHAVTNTKCVSYCAARGYSMAGTEYGGQCFCADSLASDSENVDEAMCDMACEGDEKQVCGGGLALSVYSMDGGVKRRGVRERHLRKHVRGISS